MRRFWQHIFGVPADNRFMHDGLEGAWPRRADPDGQAREEPPRVGNPVTPATTPRRHVAACPRNGFAAPYCFRGGRGACGVT